MLAFNSFSFRLAAFASASFLSICAPSAPACDHVYQPSFLTLPPLQGWSFGGNTNANASAASGTLVYGPGTFSNTTFWQADLPGGGMDFSKVTWSLTANVRLTNSSFGNVSGYQRGGFVLHLGDNTGRWITTDVGSAILNIRNDGFGTGSALASVNSQSAFRRITLEAGPSGGRVLVDGVEVLAAPLGSGGNVNSAYFGEASILASADLTEIRWVTLIPSVDTCPGDLNCDVVVDDMDFVIFASAYNILVCEDPAMPLGCPADLNNDGLVDDGDFVIFVGAYNELVCP